MADTRIKVKGKVYKVSHANMERDWVHIGDATGDETVLSDDLKVTAKNATLKAGDQVEVEATIRVDKYFGYGYFYRVLGKEAVFRPIKQRSQTLHAGYIS